MKDHEHVKQILGIQEEADDLTPAKVLAKQTRKLQARGSGNSLYVNVTEFGREILELEEGDTVEVTVLRDGILVEPADSDDETP